MSYFVEKDVSYKGMRLVVIDSVRCYEMHRCGYVGIWNDHPFYKFSYHAETRIPKTVLNDEPCGDRGIVDIFCAATNPSEYAKISHLINVHGSLTYSTVRMPATYPVPSNNLWFFGFDCAHYGDDRRYWTTERVLQECYRLANELERWRRYCLDEQSM